MIKVGIFGATGYAGVELATLLNHHPGVEIIFCTSESSAGQTLDEISPQAPRWPLIKSAEAPLDQADAVFLCLPHAASAATAVRAREAGCRVIDLSADFRLKDVETYESWYKVDHPKPEWLQEAVYGLTEHARHDLREADIVACPGCYPTSVLLPLQPIVAANGTKAGAPVIADSKSGISGGGRKAKMTYHFVEASDNMTPYAIGQNHRHWAEMQEKLSNWGNGHTPQLIFSPHLMAIPRGILSTIYVQLDDEWTYEKARALYEETYADEPFVQILPEGKMATVAHAVRSNRVAIGITKAEPNMLILTCAIDNLTKGSSGQAVQNFNIMYGLEETTALI